MKLVTYKYENVTAVGVVTNGNELIPLNSISSDMLHLIAMDVQGLAMVSEYLEHATERIALEEVNLRAPIPEPRRNIICLGKNYAAHAEESNRAWGDRVDLPEFPIIFTKATTAVNGPFDEIPYDASVSAMIDYESELAVIIGRAGRDISRDQAMDYVFGYTVMNDVSARDLQRQHQQFFKGKSLDGSAPLGPWIVTRDEIADPQNLRITCEVNGELKQDSNTSLMIFDIAETIVQLARGMTLLPGDIIATGTPSGVGFARTPPEFLKPGDIVACAVEGIGTIRNRVAK